MIYIVIKKFRDLKDGNHIYAENDFYPYCLKDIDEERIAELISCDNNFKEPVIRELTQEEKEMLNINNSENADDSTKDDEPENADDSTKDDEPENADDSTKNDEPENADDSIKNVESNNALSNKRRNGR